MAYRRCAFAVWLLAAVVLLAVTLLRFEMEAEHRAALSALVPLYFLSFPLGHAAVAGLSWLKVQLYTGPGYTLGLQAEALLLWTGLTALGLLQWFVVLPWVARRSRKLGEFLFSRLPGR